MKKSLLFSAVLAGLMLGSCSSSDDIASTSEKFSADGKGYVNVTLNLPTQPQSTSRAINDEFDHGVPDEYKVNDATLILFAGADEATATFKAAYKLDGLKKEAQTEQISTKLTKVQQINAIAAGSSGKIYAFVVLNHNNALKVTAANGLQVGTSTADFAGTFAALSKEVMNSTLTKGNLMMSNAVIVSMPGSADFSSVKATTLTDVTASIASSESEATTKPAANIYVERLAAKVTVTQDPTSTSTATVGVDGATAVTFDYDLAGWRLANINTSSYLSRQYNNTWNGYSASDFVGSPSSEYLANKFRFAGIKDIESGNGYRTYWGEDANYNTPASFSDGTAEPTLAKGESTYCYENTFNVAHQNVKETTCAIVKMKITPSGYSKGTFFTIDDNKDVVYSVDAVKTAIGNKFLNDYETKIKTSTDYYAGTTGTISVKNVEFADVAGLVDITKMTLTDGTTDKEVTAADLTTFKPTIKVNEFKDGYAYYTILIKHFGDELTPWNPSTKTTESYPDPNSEQNWLGRYGVLRNNWYKLEVTGVAAIGASTPGELDVNNDNTPDDNLKRYISCKINALSWAVRKQGTILQ